MTFLEHRETTAKDCEEVAKLLTELATQVRQGNLNAFEEFWLEGGTEEGDSKIQKCRDLMILRYKHREEKIK